jgi:hypothetical protein
VVVAAGGVTVVVAGGGVTVVVAAGGVTALAAALVVPEADAGEVTGVAGDEIFAG